MTLGTFIRIDLPGGAQDGLRGKQRIPETFVFLGNDPRFVLLVEPVDDQDANEKEKSGEKEFTEFEGERGGGGHGNRENFRISVRATKGKMPSRYLKKDFNAEYREDTENKERVESPTVEST
jgi:hypothetical protein